MMGERSLADARIGLSLKAILTVDGWSAHAVEKRLYWISMC